MCRRWEIVMAHQYNKRRKTENQLRIYVWTKIIQSMPTHEYLRIMCIALYSGCIYFIVWYTSVSGTYIYIYDMYIVWTWHGFSGRLLSHTANTQHNSTAHMMCVIEFVRRQHILHTHTCNRYTLCLCWHCFVIFVWQFLSLRLSFFFFFSCMFSHRLGSTIPYIHGVG